MNLTNEELKVLVGALDLQIQEYVRRERYIKAHETAVLRDKLQDELNAR